MKVIDVLNSPWAILPDSLEQIHEVYRAHLAGRETEWMKEARANGGVQFQAEQPSVDEAGIARISVRGPIAQRMNLMSSISGGASTSDFTAQVRAAAEDPSVAGILLEIDSPGGSVIGLQRAAEAVRAAREAKPVVAWTDSMMASAAYYIGSAASKVFIDANDTVVGSIGVVAKHLDTSAREEKAGVKVTEITAGKYKRIASQHAPLSKDGRASIQEEVDHYYAEFIDAVATNRGVSVDTVLSSMADGRVFIGTKAVDAGLVDAVATRAEAIQFLKTQAQEKRAASHRGYVMQLTPEQVKADAPDVAKALQAEGAQAERARIAAIDDIAIDGHSDLIAQMKADGTDASIAAVKLIKAEQMRAAEKAKADAEKAAAAAQARDDEAPAPVNSAAAKSDEPATAEGRKVAAVALAAEKGISFTAAYKQLYGNALV